MRTRKQPTKSLAVCHKVTLTGNFFFCVFVFSSIYHTYIHILWFLFSFKNADPQHKHTFTFYIYKIARATIIPMLSAVISWRCETQTDKTQFKENIYKTFVIWIFLHLKYMSRCEWMWWDTFLLQDVCLRLNWRNISGWDVQMTKNNLSHCHSASIHIIFC